MKIFIQLLCFVLLFSVCASAQEQCSNCGAKAAVGTPKSTKVKKKVYKVECKEIAVPDIQLPRPLFCFRQQIANLFAPKCVPGAPCGSECEQGCCNEPVRHGCVRKIKVMSKKSVECEVCKYKWEVEDLGAGYGCDTYDDYPMVEGGENSQWVQPPIEPQQQSQPQTQPQPKLESKLREPMTPPSVPEPKLNPPKTTTTKQSPYNNKSWTFSDQKFSIKPYQRGEGSQYQVIPSKSRSNR